MILIIDAQTNSLYFDQLTQLEGFEYLLRFIWSDRENCWYLNIYDQDENPLALLVRLVCGVSLLRKFVDPRLPQGVLLVCDLSNAGSDLQVPNDLQNNFPLIYITSDDPSLAIA